MVQKTHGFIGNTTGTPSRFLASTTSPRMLVFPTKKKNPFAPWMPIVNCCFVRFFNLGLFLMLFLMLLLLFFFSGLKKKTYWIYVFCQVCLRERIRWSIGNGWDFLLRWRDSDRWSGPKDRRTEGPWKNEGNRWRTPEIDLVCSY